MTETPRRMAQAYAEMLTSGSFDLTTSVGPRLR